MSTCARRTAITLLGVLAILPAPGAQAADKVPTRCAARYQGPSEGCGLQQAVRAEGLGRTEAAAARQALRNLAAAAVAARTAQAALLPAGASALFLADSGSCEQRATELAVVTCFPEPHLRDARYCWMEVEDDFCGLSQGFFLDTRAWVSGEQGRARICTERADQEQPLSAHEASCVAACWSDSSLRCGAGRER